MAGVFVYGVPVIGLGRCAIAADQPAQAGSLLRQAHDIFQRIGAADVPAVLAELSALTSPGSAQQP